MPYYAVVGASRGVGLEFVRKLARRPGAVVFAVLRNPAKSTHLTNAVLGLENVHVVAGDVADYTSLQRAAQEISALSGGKLDVLIHNAARTDVLTHMQGYDDFPNMDALDAEFITAFKINALGVVHSISAFVPLLRASTTPLKKIIVLNSRGADPSYVRNTGIHNITSYCVSKAGALVATTKWAVKLKDEGFVIVSVCPGLVNTTDTIPPESLESPEAKAALEGVLNVEKIISDLGHAFKTPEQAAAELLDITDRLKLSDNGLALSADGQWST